MIAKTPTGSFHQPANHDGSVRARICAKSLHAAPLPKDNNDLGGPENSQILLAHLSVTTMMLAFFAAQTQPSALSLIHSMQWLSIHLYRSKPTIFELEKC